MWRVNNSVRNTKRCVLTLFSAPLKGIIKQKRVKLEVKFMVVLRSSMLDVDMRDLLLGRNKYKWSASPIICCCRRRGNYTTRTGQHQNRMILLQRNSRYEEFYRNCICTSSAYSSAQVHIAPLLCILSVVGPLKQQQIHRKKEASQECNSQALLRFDRCH